MIGLKKLLILSAFIATSGMTLTDGVTELPDSSLVPRMITMSFYEDTKTQMAFNWNTTWNTLSTLQVVEKGQEFTQSNILEFEGTTSKSLVANDGFIHKVVATNLKENTAYQYRLGDKEVDVWSKVGEFKTADDSKKVEFVHISDPQGYKEEHYLAYNELLGKAFEIANPDFLALSGDIVNDSYEDETPKLEQWEWSLTSQEEYLLNVPLMTTPGNHDAASNDYTSRFNHPFKEDSLLINGSYYSFDYQGIHFVSLNTNDTINSSSNSRGLSNTQFDWLKNDLSGAKDSNFIVVMMHKGIFDAGGHCSNVDGADYDIEKLREQLAPLFTKYDVDLVLQGHDHLYSRSHPIEGYNTNEFSIDISSKEQVNTEVNDNIEYLMYDNPKGTIYLNSGTASGSKYYPIINYNQEKIPIAYADSSNHRMFTKITIDEGVLYANVYKVINGESVLFDSFGIRKNVIDNSNTQDNLILTILGITGGIIVIGGSLIGVIVLKKKKGGKK